jgi:hypothetical protein
MNSSAETVVTFCCSGMPVVFPAKRNLAVLERQETVVGDGHPMGVAAEVFDHLLRSTEGRLGVHHPFGLADWRQVGGEGGGSRKGSRSEKKLEFTVGISLFESFQEEAAEQAAEHTYGEKESRQASLPLAVGRESAAGNHAVQVGMQMQVLPPGVQHGEEADLRAQVFRVAGDGKQSGHTVRNKIGRRLLCCRKRSRQSVPAR